MISARRGDSTTYGYDSGDDLTSLKQIFPNSTVTLSYGYYSIGQRKSFRSSNDFFSGQLSTTGTVAYTPNDLNQYADVGSGAPTYDGNGDLTQENGFGNFTYTYDTEGRMITAVSSAHTLSFAYDEEGRLATTTLDGVPTSYDYNGTMPMGDWTGTAFATGATETR